MGARDPELGRLLASELRRYEATLADESNGDERCARALHALKGSAGLAGEQGLAERLARLERRLKNGDRSAASDARALVASAAEALEAGLPVGDTWPDPPPDLAPRSIEPALRARYVAEMRDRLARVDEAIASKGGEIEAVTTAFRDVHAIKGAAAAVGDEVTSWFAHGLESRLRLGSESTDAARTALLELSRWRTVLGELPIDPARALDKLRLAARGQARHSTRPPGPPDHDRGAEVATLRVPAAGVERLLERLARLGVVRDELGARVVVAKQSVRELRNARAALVEALRLIGPPRPWGAPAAAIAKVHAAAQAIGAVAEQVDGAGVRVKSAGETLHAELSATYAELGTMQRTTVRWLFDRVALATQGLARHDGREVRIALAGPDAPIDRRLAEQLLDPLVQLAKNALAHGLEPAEARVLAGKPRAGTIALRAEPRSDRLRIVVEDDGAGVDVAIVRERAMRAGTISAEMARAVDDDTLLALLFVPGFTTKDSPDLLSGRGLGLDLALGVVRRLGGTIRLASRPGRGLSVTVEVPLESGLAKVLWIRAAGAEYALPIARARRVALAGEGAPDGADAAAHLAEVLTGEACARARFVIELDAGEEAGTSWIGVDEVGEIEEVPVRPVSPIVATAGPYAGAIVRGDGTVRLVVEVGGVPPHPRRAH